MGAKLRFEVFKRDSFKCQYCGNSSPEVILHVDHIQPVSKGGADELINLITSCQGCNLGKGDRLIDDKASLEKQRAVLDELTIRREQLEMMIQWRDGLVKIDDEYVEVLVDHINSLMTNTSINDHGRKTISKWLKKFSFEEIIAACKIAGVRHFDGETYDPAAFFELVPKLINFKRKPVSEQTARYVLGILKNRLGYVNHANAIHYVKLAMEAGCDEEEIKSLAKSVSNWTQFQDEILEMIDAS